MSIRTLKSLKTDITSDGIIIAIILHLLQSMYPNSSEEELKKDLLISNSLKSKRWIVFYRNQPNLERTRLFYSKLFPENEIEIFCLLQEDGQKVLKNQEEYTLPKCTILLVQFQKYIQIENVNKLNLRYNNSTNFALICTASLEFFSLFLGLMKRRSQLRKDLKINGFYFNESYIIKKHLKNNLTSTQWLINQIVALPNLIDRKAAYDSIYEMVCKVENQLAYPDLLKNPTKTKRLIRELIDDYSKQQLQNAIVKHSRLENDIYSNVYLNDTKKINIFVAKDLHGLTQLICRVVSNKNDSYIILNSNSQRISQLKKDYLKIILENFSFLPWEMKALNSFNLEGSDFTESELIITMNYHYAQNFEQDLKIKDLDLYNFKKSTRFYTWKSEDPADPNDDIFVTQTLTMSVTRKVKSGETSTNNLNDLQTKQENINKLLSNSIEKPLKDAIVVSEVFPYRNDQFSLPSIEGNRDFYDLDDNRDLEEREEHFFLEYKKKTSDNLNRYEYTRKLPSISKHQYILDHLDQKRAVEKAQEEIELQKFLILKERRKRN